MMRKYILEPYKVLYQRLSDENVNGSVIIESFYPGFGIIFGNSLRRVAFSALEGMTVCAVRIPGVRHEFSTIPGVVDDVIDILTNLKSLRFCGNASVPIVLQIKGSGPRVVTGADIVDDNSDVVCLNPNSYICELSDSIDFCMYILIKSGRGFVDEPFDKIEDDRYFGNIDGISMSMSANFCPIESFAFEVEDMRSPDGAKCEKLILKISTDGSISPDDVVKRSASILLEQFSKIAGDMRIVESSTSSVDVDEKKNSDTELCAKLMKTVDQLELAVRASNCLRTLGNGKVLRIWQLVQMTDKDLLSLPNFGQKSLNEIEGILALNHLSLGMNIPQHILDMMKDVNGSNNTEFRYK